MYFPGEQNESIPGTNQPEKITQTNVTAIITDVPPPFFTTCETLRLEPPPAPHSRVA
jgi:hypothetical protein